MASPPRPDRQPTPRTGGSSRADAALAHRADSARAAGTTSDTDEAAGLDQAAESIAPAISPWSDHLGRAGSRAAQVLLIATVAAGAVWVLMQVRVVLIAVLVALILASAVGPLVQWLERRGWSNLLATVAAFLGILSLLGGVVTAIVLAVRSQWDELTASAGEGWNELQQLVQDGPVPVDTDTIDAALRQVTDFVTSSAFAGSALSGLSTATEFLTGLVLMIVVLFFFLKDGSKMWNFALRWLRGERRAKLAESVDRSAQVLGGYVRGTAVVASVDAVFIGIGLLVVGVPLAIPLAVIVFIGGFIPIIGAMIAGILAVLVALVTNGLVAALIVVAIVLFVQQVESNFLQPVVMGRTLSLHALVVLLALTVGTLVGGIFGAILAVPFTAVAWSVIQVWAKGYQAGHDPVLGEDPLAEESRVQSKATMAERWKYQRMRLQSYGGVKLGATHNDAARQDDDDIQS